MLFILFLETVAKKKNARNVTLVMILAVVRYRAVTVE
jgi:hypothetical protein